MRSLDSVGPLAPRVLMTFHLAHKETKAGRSVMPGGRRWELRLEPGLRSLTQLSVPSVSSGFPYTSVVMLISSKLAKMQQKARQSSKSQIHFVRVHTSLSRKPDCLQWDSFSSAEFGTDTQGWPVSI